MMSATYASSGETLCDYNQKKTSCKFNCKASNVPVLFGRS